jgi:hypothetical protein
LTKRWIVVKNDPPLHDFVEMVLLLKDFGSASLVVLSLLHVILLHKLVAALVFYCHVFFFLCISFCNIPSA